MTVLVLVYLVANLSSTSSTPSWTRGSPMTDDARGRRASPARPSCRRLPKTEGGPVPPRRRLARPAPQPAVLDLRALIVLFVDDGDRAVPVHRHVDPREAVLAEAREPRRAASTGSATTSRAATSTRGASTAPGPRSWSGSSPPLGVADHRGVFGLLAGYVGGWSTPCVSRITDIFFGIPLILGAIIILTSLPRLGRATSSSSSRWCSCSGVLSWPTIFRLMRSSVIRSSRTTTCRRPGRSAPRRGGW